MEDISEMLFELAEDEDEADSLGAPLNRTIYTDKSDPEISSLHKKHKRGKLILQPDFQRYFVWDKAKCSRLIESALLEIPLPIIYLSEEEDDRIYVIDGQQRLTAFFSYIDGKFPDGKDFKLSGLKVYTELNGFNFKDLDDSIQEKIEAYPMRTITFKKDSDDNLKFEIFERLNTGSVSLNDQELRNCIYRGPYNTLLRELACDGDFMYLIGLKKPDDRMKDVELVLRFAAFYHSTYLNYKPPMKNFLNNEMCRYQNISKQDADKLRIAFKNSVTIIRSLLDNRAFKRFYKGGESDPNGYWESKKFNYSLYDVLMYSFSSVDKNRVFQNLDSIREAFIHLMTNDSVFIDSIELSTSSMQAVTRRFDKWRLALQDITGIGQKEPRCFSSELKTDLYNRNSTCAICGNEIRSLDDAAIDHIEQYWVGGKTIPENARLTHRYCNSSRPRKE